MGSMRAATTHETIRGPDGIGEWTNDGGPSEAAWLVELLSRIDIGQHDEILSVAHLMGSRKRTEAIANVAR
jgi:hypothetical protein